MNLDDPTAADRQDRRNPADHPFHRIVRLAASLLHAPSAVAWLKAGEPSAWTFGRDCVAALEACRQIAEGGEAPDPDKAQPPPSGAFLCTPLIGPDGTTTLGAIAVHDEAPRAWSEADAEALRDLAAVAATSAGAGGGTESADARRVREAAEERFRLLVQNSSDILTMFDSEGTVLYESPSVESVLGLRPEDRVGHNIFRDTITHPDDRGAKRAFFESALARPEETVTGRFRLRHVDGTYRDIEAVAVNRLDDPAVAGVVANYRDITERHQFEEALRLALDEAEAAGRAKDQFLAVLSHELRNPLNPVLVGVSAMLADPETPASVRPTLEVVRRNVALEARLIDDLLDVTNIRQGTLRLGRQTVDAHVLVREALEICRDEIAAAGLSLTLDLSAPRYHVEGDPARLQQVLWNLIKNAAKFTPAGGSVAIRSCAAGQCSRDLVIEVIDSGVGIAPEALPRIFNAFEQADTSVAKQFGGLGLGLAISRSLAEAHGGLLTAASAGPGQGSTFTLVLPTTDAVAADPAGAGASPSAPPTDPLPPLRILLVEDNPDSRRVLSRLLGRKGHSVTPASSVAAALAAAAESGPFDVVISDLGLPDGSGLDVMRHVLSRGPVRGIALSGYGREADIRRAREAGFSSHLTKPVDFPCLEDEIRRVFWDREEVG